MTVIVGGGGDGVMVVVGVAEGVTGSGVLVGMIWSENSGGNPSSGVGCGSPRRGQRAAGKVGDAHRPDRISATVKMPYRGCEWPLAFQRKDGLAAVSAHLEQAV